MITRDSNIGNNVTYSSAITIHSERCVLESGVLANRILRITGVQEKRKLPEYYVNNCRPCCYLNNDIGVIIIGIDGAAKMISIGDTIQYSEFISIVSELKSCAANLRFTKEFISGIQKMWHGTDITIVE